MKEDTSMRYLLYNPLSGKTTQSFEEATRYSEAESIPTTLVNVIEIEDMGKFLAGLSSEDDLVVFGGDGSLNKIANAIAEHPVSNDVYYYPCGTGNDFARDVGMAEVEKPFLVTDYIKNLPTVTVKGVKSKFINGVGFGIDGYCCAVGDQLKSEGKQPDYTAIAIKGLLFHFKPANATVTVDGVTKHFKKVWIAPTMYGRFYGGGMMPTPKQDRTAEEKSVSLMLFHRTGKIQTLMIFPSLFKGEHVKHEKHVTILPGKEITVKFDRPAPLQIDGETILNVTSYTAYAAPAKVENAEAATV